MLTQGSTIYLLIKLSLSLYNKVCPCILILDSYFLSSPQMVIRKKFGLCQLPAPPKIFVNFSGIHLFFGGRRREAVTWQLFDYVGPLD